ncbi:hypothetical protein O3P69_009259 [Scylla paramamosain]|uniref:Uncharacterized protein n=1 Tax=Scylla paramamosain TaxID=85552 RepID=A0AAW0TBL6_SCYPA
MKLRNVVKPRGEAEAVRCQFTRRLQLLPGIRWGRSGAAVWVGCLSGVCGVLGEWEIIQSWQQTTPPSGASCVCRAWRICSQRRGSRVIASPASTATPSRAIAVCLFLAPLTFRAVTNHVDLTVVAFASLLIAAAPARLLSCLRHRSRGEGLADWLRRRLHARWSAEKAQTRRDCTGGLECTGGKLPREERVEEETRGEKVQEDTCPVREASVIKCLYIDCVP